MVNFPGLDKRLKAMREGNKIPQHAVPTDENAILSANELAAATKRVQARFGIKTVNLDEAIDAVSQKNDYFKRLWAIGRRPFANLAVENHMKKSARPSWIERFKAWNCSAFDWINRYLMHDGGGALSALLGLFVTIPLLTTVLFNAFVYEIDFINTFSLVVSVQLLLIFFLAISSATNETDAEDFKQLVYFFGKGYAAINAVLLSICTVLLAVPFACMYLSAPTKHNWIRYNLNEYQEMVPLEIIGVMDEVLQIIPEADFALTILEPTKDEMFLSLLFGQNEESLYLYHFEA